MRPPSPPSKARTPGFKNLLPSKPIKHEVFPAKELNPLNPNADSKKTNLSEIKRLYNGPVTSNPFAPNKSKMEILYQNGVNGKSVIKFFHKNNITIYTKRKKEAKEIPPTKLEIVEDIEEDAGEDQDSFIHLSFTDDSNEDNEFSLSFDEEQLRGTKIDDLLGNSIQNKLEKKDFIGIDTFLGQMVRKNSRRKSSCSLQQGSLDDFETIGVACEDDFDPKSFLTVEEYRSIFQSSKCSLLFKQNLASILPQVFTEGIPSEVRVETWKLVTGLEDSEFQMAYTMKNNIKTGLYLLDQILYEKKYREFYEKKKKTLEEISDFYFYFDEYFFNKSNKKTIKEIREVIKSRNIDTTEGWETVFYKNIWQIEKDLQRTVLPRRIKKTRLANAYLNSIRRVLLSFVVQNFDLGYVQGMNVLVSGMIFALVQHQLGRFLDVPVLTTEVENRFKVALSQLEGFVAALFDRIINRYQLRHCYDKEMSKIYELNRLLDDELARLDPPLFEHLFLENLGTFSHVSSSYFTCLTHITNMDFVPIILDLLFFFGLEFQNKILLQILLGASGEILKEEKDECLVHFVR